MTIVVITVVFRAGDRVLAWASALDRARAASPLPVRVIAVDNASGDDTVARLRAAAPWVEVLEQAENRGFAAGCNVGIAQLDPGDVAVLLNPDVTVSEDFFATLAAAPIDDGIAAVGPQVTGADGALEQSARAFPSFATGLFGRTSLLARLRPEGRATRGQLLADPTAGGATVDWVSGACMIVPADALAAVGGFDEGYWMYWEDADWCRRATDQGLVVRYAPELRVTHHQGSSSAALPVRTTLAFHRSAGRYYRVHSARGPVDATLVRAVLMTRAVLELLAARLRRR